VEFPAGVGGEQHARAVIAQAGFAGVGTQVSETVRIRGRSTARVPRWSPGRHAATSTSISAGPPVWVKPGYQRQKQPARSLLTTAVRILDEELGSGR